MIWIENQALRFMGPGLDRFCLKRPLKIDIFLDIVRKYFHFVQKHLQGTVNAIKSGTRDSL